MAAPGSREWDGSIVFLGADFGDLARENTAWTDATGAASGGHEGVHPRSEAHPICPDARFHAQDMARPEGFEPPTL